MIRTVYDISAVLSFSNNAIRNFKSVKTLASKCKFEFDISLLILYTYICIYVSAQK